MITTPAGHVRFYEDGPWFPQTPTQQAAEQAYRAAFLKAAREAAQWTEIDEAAIERAWDERRRARARAEVLVPSSVVYNDPRLDSDQVLYVEGHEVEAGRTRGRVHGFEFVRQCHEELVKVGVAMSEIGPTILVPWLTHVAEWVARDIDRDRVRYVVPTTSGLRRALVLAGDDADRTAVCEGLARTRWGRVLAKRIGGES